MTEFHFMAVIVCYILSVISNNDYDYKYSLGFRKVAAYFRLLIYLITDLVRGNIVFEKLIDVWLVSHELHRDKTNKFGICTHPKRLSIGLGTHLV